MTTSTLYRNAGQDDRCSEWFPWEWCNLRRNPFGELTRGERAALAVADVTRWCEMLHDAFQRGRRIAIQFIGRAGRGKTTRMLALASHLPESTYTYIAKGVPCPSIPWGRPILIDEAQRLTRKARAAVFASGEPIALGTHRNLTGALRWYGYGVTTYRIGRGNHATLLCELARRRIEASRLHSGHVPVLTQSDAERLIRRFGTDFRAIEAFLYERIQSQCYSHGEMRFID